MGEDNKLGLRVQKACKADTEITPYSVGYVDGLARAQIMHAMLSFLDEEVLHIIMVPPLPTDLAPLSASIMGCPLGTWRGRCKNSVLEAKRFHFPGAFLIRGVMVLRY